MASYLGQSGAEQERINRELGEDSDQVTILDTVRHKVQVWDCRKKVSTRNIANGNFFIVGHPTYGLIGSTLLQYNPLPDTELLYVQNSHNIFPEGFWNDRFVDTDISTGSIYIGSGYYIDNQEYFQSSYIAKEDKVYKSINLSYDIINSSTGSDASDWVDIYAVIGSSLFSLTEGDNIINNLSDDGIKIKIVNNLNLGEEFPITWPINFSEIALIKINSYKIKYSV